MGNTTEAKGDGQKKAGGEDQTKKQFDVVVADRKAGEVEQQQRTASLMSHDCIKFVGEIQTINHWKHDELPSPSDDLYQWLYYGRLLATMHSHSNNNNKSLSPLPSLKLSTKKEQNE
eukprot:GHVS01050552.1.p1 GENE.GHVS01050552.1~~GHVS01050552.1.p1  ORF type:complete len:117 (-),score=40.26 GHVS01050552.1:3-353(-)